MKTKLLLLVLVALFAAPAMAQVSATTNVNMNMPSLVVLYYRGDITFDINDTTLSSILLTGSNPNDEGAASITDFTGDAAVTGADYDDPSALVATVTNFWAVRSVAPSTQQTRVTVAITGATLTNPDSDTIGISNPLTRVSAGSFVADNVSFAPTGLGLGTIQLGDVQFDVDLSGVATPGAYTGGAIQITAENI